MQQLLVLGVSAIQQEHTEQVNVPEMISCSKLILWKEAKTTWVTTTFSTYKIELMLLGICCQVGGPLFYLCFCEWYLIARHVSHHVLITGFWIAWNFGFAYLRHCSVDILSCCSLLWYWSSSWSCRSLRSFRCCRRCCQPCKRCCRRCSFRSSSMSFWWLCASLWITCCRFPLVYRKYRCA